MLSFSDVACRRDGKRLFGDVDLVIHAGQKVGLTGANGTGKSSLFAMIRGTLEPDVGTISLQQQVGITHVAQETPSSDRSALDYLIDGDDRIRSLQRAIEDCPDSDGERLGSLLADLEQAGGYSVHARAGAMLNGLGFAVEQHQWPVSRFSGGWRMRLNLGQALMSPNELLLLDEPTNHLDLDAVLWLESWLRQREGTLILVSHDREFLDAVTDMTLHIEAQTVTLVSGNYSAFERWRAARMANQQAAHEKAQARRRELQGFVDRFRAKASKARQAQSRLKMLERLGETSAVRPESPFTFSFRTPENMPSPLVVLQQAQLGYGQTVVLDAVNLTVLSGDRIGLLGVNGAGKSTLVKALVGSLSLMRGQRVPAQKLKVGYFAQHQVDQLRSDLTPMQALQVQDPSLSENQVRTFLGTFGFSGDRALQITATLSGGERARLALALIVQTRPNLLLLDEPTNHLDIVMRQALADALVAFDGALIVISHDRTMLRSVVDELWLVADGTVQPFDDDLDGYARWLSRQRQKSAETAREYRRDPAYDSFRSASAGVGTLSDKEGGHRALQASARSSSGADAATADAETGRIDAASGVVGRRAQKRLEAERRARLAPLTRAVNEAERQLELADKRLSQVRDRLGDGGLYHEDRKQELNELLDAERSARQDMDNAEEKLLASMESLETANRASEERQ